MFIFAPRDHCGDEYILINSFQNKKTQVSLLKAI